MTTKMLRGKRIRLAAQVIGLSAVGFVLAFLIGETSTEFLAKGWEVITIEVILLGVITGVALAGCILSWWRELVAGTLLLLSAVLWGTGIPLLTHPLLPHDVGTWLIIGLPCLVAGVLLLNSWRLLKITGSRKAREYGY